MTETAQAHETTELVGAYLAAWNAVDPAERARCVARAFTEAASYGDPLASAAGQDGIAALIGAVQAQFPGLAFRPAGKIDAYGDKLRFSWELAPAAGGAAVAGGTDFAVVSGGRLQAVTGFLDFVPAG